MENVKILAVIPARRNSKRIPNKNIRLLSNHPLVYYVMKNALDSKYITDIIVTTDSQEVETISKQLGIQSIHRPENLCQDDTTLDAVVYHAVQGGSLITLLPCSRLLLF